MMMPKEKKKEQDHEEEMQRTTTTDRERLDKNAHRSFMAPILNSLRRFKLKMHERKKKDCDVDTHADKSDGVSALAKRPRHRGAIKTREFYNDCGCRENEWIDIGFWERNTGRLLADFEMRHFRLNAVTGELEYRHLPTRHFDILDQAPGGHFYMSDAEVMSFDRDNTHYQVSVRCASERSFDVSKSINLKLRTRSKLHFDKLLKTLCTMPKIKFSAAPNTSTFLSIRQQRTRTVSASSSSSQSRRKTRKLTARSSSSSFDEGNPRTIAAKSDSRTDVRNDEKTVDENIERSQVSKRSGSIDKIKVLTGDASAVSVVESQRKKSLHVPKSVLRRMFGDRIDETSSMSKFVPTFDRIADSFDMSTSTSGSSTVISTDSVADGSNRDDRDAWITLGPMMVRTSEDSESERETLIVRMRGHVLVLCRFEDEDDPEPDRSTDSTMRVFINSDSFVDVPDVWSLNVRLRLSSNEDSCIDIAGWHNCPQQAAQLLALLARSGAQMSESANIFVEEIMMIQTHEAYFAHAKDTLKIVRQNLPLKDWEPLSTFLSAALIKDAEYRLRRELSSKAFMSKYMHAAVVSKEKKDPGDDMSGVWPKLKGKHAIFVLGPSAVGKTHSTVSNFDKVLKSNGWAQGMYFLSLDGGLVRENSVEWGVMTRKTLEKSRTCRYAGISNLNSAMFKSQTDAFKRRVFLACLKHGRNMIIPETAASAMPGVPNLISWMIDELRKAGYKVVMTAVSATRERCRRNGLAREMKEGKKYSSLSWSFAVEKIPVCFTHARHAGYVEETFFIVENSDWSNVRTIVVPPQYSVRCTKVSKVTKYVPHRPSYSGEPLEDSVPLYSIYMLPPRKISDMLRVHRGEVHLQTAFRTFEPSALQLCTHGRSLWLVSYPIDNRTRSDGLKCTCVGRRSVIFPGEDESVQEMFKKEEDEKAMSDRRNHRKNRWRPSIKLLFGDTDRARRICVAVLRKPSRHHDSIGLKAIRSLSTRRLRDAIH
eukprot:g2240.t1